MLGNHLKKLKNYQLMGVDFLHNNYSNKFKGVILNEERNMNMQLQVVTFLFNIIAENKTESSNLMLIICPMNCIIKWHYHLINDAQVKVKIINGKTCPEEFDTEKDYLALLLPFTELKLEVIEALNDYKFKFVIVDDFDNIATKLVMKKISGDFNIGLSERNFYLNPDLKIQWAMLNWSNPGCAGKLAEYYDMQMEDFSLFRNPFGQFWFRLTWKFSEDFSKPSEADINSYRDKIVKWAVDNDLSYFDVFKSVSISPSSKNSSRKRKFQTIPSDKIKKEIKFDQATSTNLISSEMDIKTEKQEELSEELASQHANLPKMDESPILTSIIKKFEEIPDPEVKESGSEEKTAEQDDFLLSILSKNSSISTKDEPSTSKSTDNEDFLHSLIFGSRSSDDY